MTHRCSCVAQRSPCPNRVPTPDVLCYECRTVCPPTAPRDPRPTNPRGTS